MLVFLFYYFLYFIRKSHEILEKENYETKTLLEEEKSRAEETAARAQAMIKVTPEGHATFLLFLWCKVLYLVNNYISSKKQPSEQETFVWHLYKVGPTSKTLGRRCTNVIQMFCVCWEGAL